MIEETKFAHIKGWGVDARQDAPLSEEDSHPGAHSSEDSSQMDQQPATVEVLMSNERPYMTTVFGSGLPPSGLSGLLRRYAFKHSESSYRHWLPLLMADRINVVEGLLQDLAGGKLPNIFRERGMKAAWKYDRPAVYRKTLVCTLAVLGLAALLKKRRNR